MGIIVSCSISRTQRDFLEKHNISPSSIMQAKIDELMIQNPEALQIKISELKAEGMTKWQRAYWACTTYEQRQELLKEFHNAIMENESI